MELKKSKQKKKKKKNKKQKKKKKKIKKDKEKEKENEKGKENGWLTEQLEVKTYGILRWNLDTDSRRNWYQSEWFKLIKILFLYRSCGARSSNIATEDSLAGYDKCKWFVK